MTPERIAELRDDPFSVRAREVRYLLDLAESHERLREACELLVEWQDEPAGPDPMGQLRMVLKKMRAALAAAPKQKGGDAQ